MKENGFEYVDLGLPSGTMWATCNVGADKPEDEGLLFQFGRVDGYRYGDSNNQFRTNKQNLIDGTLYTPQTTSSKVYNENDILDLEDDVVHVHMGGKWRMPTGGYNESTKQYEGDFNEMLSNTKHDVCTVNGVAGMLFTSNINGHKLFIPFIQGYWRNRYSALKSTGLMWFSKVYSSDANRAYTLGYNYSRYADLNVHYRIYALPVRGVFNS